MTLTLFVNQFLSILTILAQILIVVLAVYLFTNKPAFLKPFVSKTFLLAFLVALVAMLGSLTYSDILGYNPCKLCWFQRILMYPQVILLGIALFKKDYKIADYSIVLSIMGALLAGYHYLLQRGVMPDIGCSTVGYSVSCSKIFTLQYGYITIPMMAFTAFTLMALLLFAHKRNLLKNT